MTTTKPLALALLFSLSGCGSETAIGSDAGPGGTPNATVNGSRMGTGSACPGLISGPTGTTTATIQAYGRERSYVLTAPANPTQKLALVFVWHGDGGTGMGVRNDLALEGPAADGAVFVYADGIEENYGWWEIDQPAATNKDIALFDALLAYLPTRYCIDTNRVFSTGFSRGGYFSNHLACERGDRLRAIAPQSGGGPYGMGERYNGDGQLECPTAPVPALVIHGNADTEIPNDPNPAMPMGGWQGFRHWTYWNHAEPRNTLDFATDPISPSPCRQARGLPAGKPVIACFIDGLGHAPWQMSGPTVWAFFSRFR